MKLSDRLAAAGTPEDAGAEPTRAKKRHAPRKARAASSTANNRTKQKAAPKTAGRHTAKKTSPRAGDTGSTWNESKRAVRKVVLERLAPRMGELHGDELNDEVRSLVDEILREEDVQVTPRERNRFVDEVIQDTLGYGPLDPLLADEEITEIMCNAYDDIWVEQDGRLSPTDVQFTDNAQYRHVIDKIVSAVGRRVDESSPMVDARLPDGSRVNAVIPPLAIGGSVLTIRKFSADPYTAQDLIAFGTWTLDTARVLEAAVAARLNILVSGGTGTGKTTNLNVLSSFIPDDERIITIEDAAELQLQQPHVINLETRPANAEGAGYVGIRELVRNALRMRPDRIIVGECRGAEALDMLQAMNTGHEGSLTTVHANGPREALARLETMVLMAGYDLPVRAIREQIASAIHVIMQVDRFPDGRRVVTSITEVQGMEGDTLLLQELFGYRHTRAASGKSSGALEPTGLRPGFADRMKDLEVDLPASLFRVNPSKAKAQPRRRSRAPKPSDVVARERRR